MAGSAQWLTEVQRVERIVIAETKISMSSDPRMGIVPIRGSERESQLPPAGSNVDVETDEEGGTPSIIGPPSPMVDRESMDESEVSEVVCDWGRRKHHVFLADLRDLQMYSTIHVATDVADVHTKDTFFTQAHRLDPVFGDSGADQFVPFSSPPFVCWFSVPTKECMSNGNVDKEQ